MLKKIKNLSKEIGTLSLGLALALIIFMGLSIAKGAWNEPTLSAPNDNVGAPINTSATAQDKAGQMGSVGGGAYGTGALKIGIHTLNSNNNGWLYLGNQFNGVYSSRGLAVDNSWTNSNAYFAGGMGIWNSAGNVGIGTTNPNHKLVVAGTDPVAHFMSSGGNAYLRLSIYNDINRRIELANRNGRTALYNPQTGDAFNVVHATGNVGIGTASPATKLDVAGDIQFNNTLRTPWRMYITGEERLYLLNKNGVYISSAWGGNGYLEVGNLTSTNTLRVRNGAGAGKVLTSDANGNANWAAPVGGGLSCVITAQVAGVDSAQANCAAGYTVVGGACSYEHNHWSSSETNGSQWVDNASFAANGYVCSTSSTHEDNAFVRPVSVSAQARCCK